MGIMEKDAGTKNAQHHNRSIISEYIQQGGVLYKYRLKSSQPNHRLPITCSKPHDPKTSIGHL